MKHPLLHALGCATLVCSFFFAPMSGAQAGQTIDITVDPSDEVCGNAVDTTPASATYGLCSSGLNAQDGNTVTIEAGVNSPGAIYGRKDESGTSSTFATSNTVSVFGYTAGSIGGYALTTGSNLSSTAYKNTVSVSGTGLLSGATGGKAQGSGGYSIASATENTVSIDGDGASGSATIIGGDASCATECTADASKNTVSFTGGTTPMEIRGGSAQGGTGTITASENTVSITGGTWNGSLIYGAYATGAGTVEAKDNIVEIGGSASLSSLNLYGAYVSSGGTVTTTGNTLKLSISDVDVAQLGGFQNLNFTLPKTLGDGGTMLTANSPDIDGVTVSVAVESGSRLSIGDRIVLIDASAGGGFTGTLASTTVTNPSTEYQFKIDTDALANDDMLVVEVTALPKPPTPTPTPTPTPPSPVPVPVIPACVDGAVLAAGSTCNASAGNSSFCLGDSGSAPVTVRIDNVPYTIAPLSENTCFEVFSTGTGRALILDSGSAEIGTIVPGATLLEARNGDLVKNDGNATIRATVDSTCTSTRVSVLEGKVDAPEWITSPMPASGCPEDALTPPKSRFMVSDGKLACPPSALAIKGTWAKLTVKHTQNLSAGQQVFDVAGYAPAGWFQNGPHGWAPLGGSFEPVDTATESGQRTTTLVNGLDVRGILGTELYTGHGANAEEMMGNGRYCGVLRVAP